MNMVDFLIFLKNNLAEHFALYFIPLYILGGRPTAILSAQLVGYTNFFLLPVVMMLDIFQVPVFFYLSGTISKNNWVLGFRERNAQKHKKIINSKLFSKLQIFGLPGVIIVTLLPVKGCGMLSGFLLTRIIGLSKQITYLVLGFGSIAGCLLLTGLGEIIILMF